MPITGPRPPYIPPTSTSLGAKLVGGLQTPQPNRISLKDDRFTLILESGQVHPNVPPSLQLQVIMVGGNEHVSRVYYAADDAYDAENPNAPTCWSDNGVGPSEKVPTPVSPTCAQCPNSVWGSKITAMGSKVPACAHRKKIAVLVAGAGNTPFLLDVPPASLKSFGKYMARLGGELHADPCDVVTLLKVENKTLIFDDSMWVPEAMKEGIHAIVETGEGDRICGSDDRPHQMRLAPPTTFSHAQQPTMSYNPQPQPGAQPLQHVPYEPIPETFTAQPMTANEAASFQSHPQPEPPKERKPRAPRTPKETVVGPGPIDNRVFDGRQGAATVEGGIPATQFAGTGFIQSNAPATGTGFIQGAQPAPQFGMAPPQATAPTGDLDAMLAGAFGLKLPGK